MESNRILPKGILFPFILLTTLFFAWAVPNNLTDTMLAAFKRIMSISDSKTAWIQIVCYLLGYGCCAIPGALFIKKYTYKSGVMLGLGLYALGALLFYNIGNYRLRSINQNLFIYNFYMFFVAFVELTVFLLFQHEQLFYHIYRFPFWLFVLSSGIGYAFIQSVSFFSIKKIGPFSTSFFMAFNPLFTYIFSLFFLKESFDWMILIGFLCIFIASLAILKETLKQNKF